MPKRDCVGVKLLVVKCVELCWRYSSSEGQKVHRSWRICLKSCTSIVKWKQIGLENVEKTDWSTQRKSAKVMKFHIVQMMQIVESYRQRKLCDENFKSAGFEAIKLEEKNCRAFKFEFLSLADFSFHSGTTHQHFNLISRTFFWALARWKKAEKQQQKIDTRKKFVLIYYHITFEFDLHTKYYFFPFHWTLNSNLCLNSEKKTS